MAAASLSSRSCSRDTGTRGRTPLFLDGEAFVGGEDEDEDEDDVDDEDEDEDEDDDEDEEEDDEMMEEENRQWLSSEPRIGSRGSEPRQNKVHIIAPQIHRSGQVE